MTWRDELVERLVAQPCCGYGAGDSFATEPSALAAIALAGENQLDACKQVGAWLIRIQGDDGAIGVREHEPYPAWTTSLAAMVWLAIRSSGSDLENMGNSLDQALGWILRDRGETMERDGASGHDPTLVAWSWVPGTHAWIEPTAFHVMALKQANLGHHPRTRTAVEMLLNRQLPRGGCNYGNTFVLEQQLRAHVQPTALALLALAGESDLHGRARQSLTFLRQNISRETSTTSLCWSLLAMAAHGSLPTAADEWLENAYHKIIQRSASPLKLALLALAAQKHNSFLARVHRNVPSIVG